jgi:hypothetical protein
MSEIDLNAQRLRELVSYNPDTGEFHCLIRRGSKAEVGMKCGALSAGYIRISIGAKLYAAHRLAWLYMTGEWPTGCIDHRDTDKSNNRWSNLRDRDHSGNMQNQRVAHKNNQTGFLGVFKSRTRFRAGLSVDGRNLSFGTYDTPELAYAAYLEAKRLHHQGNTL